MSNSPPFGGVLNGVRRGGLKTLDDVYDIIDENGSITRQKANEIINSITICDPAVGSGHFLVSALNEILAIKNDLRILQDRDGRRLKEYNVSVVNDELIITDENNSLFEYNYQNKESQRVQEAIFHEKQTIIENCLFGVDINPNSVKICRLRLWIELLKHAYYKSENELETLPNIDINIKCGNSLISRFEIDADLKQALKSSKWNIQSYRNAVATYRNAKNKEEKREMERLINDIKNDFRTEINKNSKEMIKLFKLEKEQYEKFVAPQLFGHTLTPAQKKKLEEEHKTINTKIETLKAEIEEIKNNKIYINAFEWRFEFPEVLSEEGDFVGFDVVVGNPPYDVFQGASKKAIIPYLTNEIYDKCKNGKINAFELFLSKTDTLIKINGHSCQIFQNSFLTDNSSKGLRKFFIKDRVINQINSFPERDNVNKRVFENAKMSVCIMLYTKEISDNYTFKFIVHSENSFKYFYSILFKSIEIESFDPDNFIIPTLMEKEKSIFMNYYTKNYKRYSEKYNCLEGELNMTFHKDYMVSDEALPLIIKGAQVQRYFITKNPSQGSIQFVDKNRYLNDYPNSKKANHHNEERIALQGISGANDKIRIISTLIEKNSFCANSCNYIINLTEDENYNIRFLLGIFNSKFTNWIYRKSSTNSNVNCYEINNLKLPNNYNNQITDLVNQILAAKKQDPEADTQELEDEIDYLVYKLYDLTYDEVLIVDPDTKITREEY